MSWSEADRALLRHYLGFGALFLQADSRLEAALSAVQSVADGGTRPDDSTERLIRGWLAALERIERRLRELWAEAEALKVDDLGVDPYRGLALVRSEGRRLVSNIARALGTAPRHDVFSAMAPSDSPYPW